MMVCFIKLSNNTAGSQTTFQMFRFTTRVQFQHAPKNLYTNLLKRCCLEGNLETLKLADKILIFPLAQF